MELAKITTIEDLSNTALDHWWKNFESSFIISVIITGMSFGKHFNETSIILVVRFTSEVPKNIFSVSGFSSMIWVIILQIADGICDVFRLATVTGHLSKKIEKIKHKIFLASIFNKLSTLNDKHKMKTL